MGERGATMPQPNMPILLKSSLAEDGEIAVTSGNRYGLTASSIYADPGVDSSQFTLTLGMMDRGNFDLLLVQRPTFPRSPYPVSN